MPRLLAVDTSTEACSVALLDGERVIERFFEAPREHVQRLLPMVDELLVGNNIALRDIDAIAFGRGPGSFTGLRICLGVVQGLAFGANLPVIPVSTLAALAQSAIEDNGIARGDHVLSAIDARMDEIYCGWFRVGDDGLVIAINEEQVCAPELLPVLDVAGATSHGVGSGMRYVARMPPLSLANTNPAQLPHAAAIAALALPLLLKGGYVSADDAQPVYLRNDVAWAKP